MSVNPATGVNAVVSAITGAIRQAAQVTSTSFGYLLATAKVESNFDPSAKASTSSASGLFQFIEQTWLSTMKEAGPRLGYSQFADAITKTPAGRLTVADPAMRAQILNLRHDPTANAVMAGAFTEKNASLLSARLGRPPSEGELYIAHFLGASGAAKLITSTGQSRSSAAELFPNAASANRSIFYDKQGRARSAGEVYAVLTHRYDVARADAVAPAGAAVAAAPSPPAARQMAVLRPKADIPNIRPTTAPQQVAVARPKTDILSVRRPPAPTQVAALIPDTAGIAQAFAASEPIPERVADAEPVFQALFHTGERREPLAQRVNQLWGTRTASATASGIAPADGASPGPARGGPLDLFQDMAPDVRGLFGNKG
jgi:hypothetical protein